MLGTEKSLFICLSLNQSKEKLVFSVTYVVAISWVVKVTLTDILILAAALLYVTVSPSLKLSQNSPFSSAASFRTQCPSDKTLIFIQ